VPGWVPGKSIAFPDDGHSACGDRLRYQSARIHSATGHGDENIAGANLTAVGHEALKDNVEPIE
jgi:hypothetical protein